jgi:hypothetical protein
VASTIKYNFFILHFENHSNLCLTFIKFLKLLLIIDKAMLKIIAYSLNLQNICKLKYQCRVMIEFKIYYQLKRKNSISAGNDSIFSYINNYFFSLLHFTKVVSI